MTAPESVATVPGDPHLPLIAQQALSRSSGAQFIAGNAVRVLRDSTENYPAWLAAIAAARRTILFENYIIGKDEIGREFVAALAAKAREGVRVRLVYDWVGTPFAGKLFRPLVEAGRAGALLQPAAPGRAVWLAVARSPQDDRGRRRGRVRRRPVCGEALDWRSRRGIPPWRDTGVEVHGPAVAEIERAFKQVWDAIGPRASGRRPAEPLVPRWRPPAT